MAMMVGGMMIHGIVPGPQIMTQEPSLFWGLIVSMWVGNLMLLVINLPLVGLWVKLLKVPYRLLYVAILLLCCVGVYSLNNEPADVLLLAIFGLLGNLLVKLGFELPPLALGLVLGGMMEENFRQAMLISRGSPLVFIESPLSAVFLALSALWLVIAVSPSIRRRRNEVFVEA
jgi:putative tricarboxylic transport membrane protein